MAVLADLQKTMKKLKKVWKADKSDKANKKAFKAAKAAFEKAKEDAEKAAAAKEESSSSSSEAEEEKKPVVDIKALKKAVKAAKAEYKKDKTNKAAKKALKAAKAALAEAESSTMDEEKKSKTAGEKRSRDEAETTDAPVEEKPAEDSWEALSAKKKQKTAASTDPNAAPPNAKCFIGNLSYDIDDDAVKEFFKDCGNLVDIFWLKDRESGQFKGCGFITFESVDQATKACAKVGMELMGRELKINFAKPRPGGDRKTPRKSFQAREMSEKPPGCVTCFVGNLSFNIDEGAMKEFAKDCGGISNIRWLSDRETGNFKGCGFIDFESTEGVDNFVKLNGKDLMGRGIRIDYAKSRN